MISQHSQTATLTVEVSQEQSTQGMLLDAIARSAEEEAMPIFPTQDPNKLTKYKHLGKAGSPEHVNAVMQVQRRVQLDSLLSTLVLVAS
ncbi:MAG: hypothetical protein ACFKPT_13675 [Gloeotrichia echinulata GP01]